MKSGENDLLILMMQRRVSSSGPDWGPCDPRENELICLCEKSSSLPQAHSRCIYVNKNLSSQLRRSKLESLFTECNSRSVIQSALPTTFHTAHNKSDDVMLNTVLLFSCPQLHKAELSLLKTFFYLLDSETIPSVG